MPPEYGKLLFKPEKYKACPNCNEEPFESMMRGLVQSWWRKMLGMEYCAVICLKCKEIVGMEKP